MPNKVYTCYRAILKAKIATEATIKIMDTFVKIRRLINENKDIFKRVIEIENKTDYIESALKEHDNKMEDKEYLENLIERTR